MIVVREWFGPERCLKPSAGGATLTNMCSPTTQMQHQAATGAAA
jgi:hypothetical protein